MSKCANPTCGAFTLATYCKPCSITNRAVNDAVESALESAGKSLEAAKIETENETIYAIIASIKAEHSALKEEAFPENLVSQEYLDGLEHGILLIQNEYAPEMLEESFAVDAELHSPTGADTASPYASEENESEEGRSEENNTASPSSRSVWDATNQEEADRIYENSTYYEFWTNMGRVDERHSILRELNAILAELGNNSSQSDIISALIKKLEEKRND